MTKAIIVASFGTTHEDAEQKNIMAVERAIGQRFPNYHLCRAYTSTMIMRTMRSRGREIDDVGTALQKLCDSGYEQVYIVPTHVIPGEEYEKVCRAARAFEGRFKSLKISRPLLDLSEDIVTVGTALARHNPIEKNECLVLFGHGSGHYSNTVYSAMEHMLKESVCERVIVGTVDGYPTLEDVKNQIAAKGYSKAVLAPLMLVAGDHAKNDMASDKPASWRSQLAAMGVEVTPVIKGLGEYREAVELYCRHAAEIIES
ncbi:MAG: sirohydrochlorin cobaltochelatase [Oscillospiraceae bacterium]